MEDISLTQLPSGPSASDQLIDPKSVVWNAPKPDADHKKCVKDGKESRREDSYQYGHSVRLTQRIPAHDSRLSRSQTLPSTSSASSLSQPANSLTHSWSNPSRKRKRQRPSTRRLSSTNDVGEQDDSTILDVLPITPEMIQNLFKSVTERVEAEVANARVKDDGHVLAQRKTMKERGKKSSRTMRELKNLGASSGSRRREGSPEASNSVSPLNSTTASGTDVVDPADSSSMDIDELMTTARESFDPSSSSSQLSNRTTAVILRPQASSSRSACGSKWFDHRLANTLAPFTSHAEALGQTKAGTENLSSTPAHYPTVSCDASYPIPPSISPKGEASAAATPTSSQPSSAGVYGGGVRSKSSMIPLASGSKLPSLGMRRTATVGSSVFSSSQSLSSGLCAPSQSSQNSSMRTGITSSVSKPTLPTRQKQFRPPFAKTMNSSSTTSGSSGTIASIGKNTLVTTTTPQTPTGHDRQSFVSGLPTPSSSTKPSPAVRFIAQASRKPSPLRKSIVPTLISPPQSQQPIPLPTTPIHSPSASIASAASPPPPSMEVMDVEPRSNGSPKKTSGDRSSSPAADANISFTSADFDMGIDADELERACSMFD